MAGIHTAPQTESSALVRHHPMPFGAQLAPDGTGVYFRLWAPSAQQITLVLETGEEQFFPMQAKPDGWFEAFTPQAGDGTLYRFQLASGLKVPDPASRFQPQDVHGPSQVIDPARFRWKDANWNGRPWEETILYELHVGSFTPEGTFEGVRQKLDYLVDLGVTAIELMPLSDFPGGRNWGYDGVLHYAPDSRYGTPDDLKHLIQTAHQKGLMVFLDVVYNHFGPDGNYLHTYAQDFFTEHYHTPWGAGINFEGAQPVREFFIQNALYWLNEYHFDGLRFDAVHAIEDASSRHILNELAETVRATIRPGRHVHLVLENDDNACRFLAPANQSHTQAQTQFNAQWNDDFHHAAHVVATGEQSGYYADYVKNPSGKTAVEHLARCLTEGFAYQGEHSAYRDEPRGSRSAAYPLSDFVNFLQNHDQVGNRAFGERLCQLTEPATMRALLTVFLLAPSIPLLFMGEEWQSEKPFLFFCDFGPELAKLVTEGRRKEFARFPEFSDSAVRERIPDPGAPETFEASVLDWEVSEQAKHAEWRHFYRELLGIRKREIIPWLAQLAHDRQSKRNCKFLGETGILAQWTLGNGSTLILAANLGADALTLPLRLFDNIGLDRFRVLYQTAQTVIQEVRSGQLSPWSVIWLAD